MRKSKPDDEAEKKATSYTLGLAEEQMETLRLICKGKGWESYDVAHARFAFRGPKVNVVAYKSGKLVIQGKGTEDFVVNILEPQVTKDPRMGYDEVLHPEWFESHAGLDESGKGDFFGPLVSAAVVADRPAIEAWIKAGIRDSKRIGEKQILRLDKAIRDTRGAAVNTVFCGMRKYNELMSRQRANLNLLLAWQHARALEDVLKKKRVRWGMLDQFSKRPLVQRYFKDSEFDLKMRTRAEDDPVVAAASVVARAEYVRQMQKLSEKAEMPLLKGASAQVRAQAELIVKKFGAGALGDFAKLHFRTAYEVLAATGTLDDVALPAKAYEPKKEHFGR